MHMKNQYFPGTELLPPDTETMVDTFPNPTGKTQQEKQ